MMPTVPWLGLCLALAGLVSCVDATGGRDLGPGEQIPDSGSDADSSQRAPALPVIVVDSPSGSTFVPDGEEVVLSGRVTEARPDDAPTLLVDGHEVPLDRSGGFSVPLGAGSPGVNVVDLRVTTRGGGRAVQTTAYYRGPLTPPRQWIPAAVLLQANQEFLDDGRPDPDDVATFMAALLKSRGFLDYLCGEYDYDGVTIDLTSLVVGDALVTIELDGGVMGTTVVLQGLEGTFTGQAGSMDLAGRVTADMVEFTSDLAPDRSEGGVALVAQGVEVAADGFFVQFEGTEDWPESSRRALSDAVGDYLVGTLEEELGPLMADTISGFLGSFGFDYVFGDENPVTLHLAVGGLDLGDGALVLTMAAMAEADSPVTMPATAGSLRTPGRAPGALDRAEPIQVAVDDDLLNQLLFTSWSSGTITGWKFDRADLARAGEGLAKIPPPFGPVSSITLMGRLPFSLVPPREPGFLFDMVVGDLGLLVQREDSVSIGLRIGFRAGARFVMGGGGRIGLVMDDRPRHLDLSVAVDEGIPGLDPGNLAALARVMIPPFLAKANEIAGDATIPPIPLGSLGSLVEGVTMEPTVTRVDVVGEGGGYLMLGGRLSFRGLDAL